MTDVGTRRTAANRDPECPFAAVSRRAARWLLRQGDVLRDEASDREAQDIRLLKPERVKEGECS